MKSVLKYKKNPRLILLGLDRLKIITLNDREYINLIYYEKFNKYPNLDQPNSFDEKLQ